MSKKKNYLRKFFEEAYSRKKGLIIIRDLTKTLEETFKSLKCHLCDDIEDDAFKKVITYSSEDYENSIVLCHTCYYFIVDNIDRGAYY